VPEPYRLLILSSRPEIVKAVEQASATLEPAPLVSALVRRPTDFRRTDLVVADVGEPGATYEFLRTRLGRRARLVALLDGAWIDRFGDALAGDWYDYLFFPISGPELRLVWSRHTSPETIVPLSLDVDESGRIRLTVPALVEYHRPAVERVVEAARHLASLDADAMFRVRVAVGEAVANAMLYGGRGDSVPLVHIAVGVDDETLSVRIRDEGAGFDPTAVPDPTAIEGLERNQGRGLLLLRRLSDEVSFNDVGNEVTLTFRGGLDPMTRVSEWLPSFADLTGLRFRVEHEKGGRTAWLHRGWAEGPAPAIEDTGERTIGGEGIVRLAWERPPGDRDGADRAADVLAGILGVLVETGASREHWVAWRLRRQRVLAELEVARDLQLRLLPPADRFSDLASIDARCEPALSLGGDFYFLSRLADGRLGIMLGDVSSHGPSAALIMALTLSAAAMATKGDGSPVSVLSGMHDHLLRALESTEMYMTLFYAALDPRTGAASYSSAGHPYAYRVRSNALERLPATDPPIGMSAPPLYHERDADWRAGDALLLFTDGLTVEGADPATIPHSRLSRRVARGTTDPAALVAALFAGLEHEIRLDDRTAVAVRLEA